ncbi:MAG: hypothetical protein V1933_06070 [Candidatus Omnitrophota bacterium]
MENRTEKWRFEVGSYGILITTILLADSSVYNVGAAIAAALSPLIITDILSIYIFAMA